MRSRNVIAAAILCGFLAVVFTVAFLNNKYFPVSVIAGETSVGTWVSGMLLVVSATISLIFAMRRGWFPWSVISLFFLGLALDERFMFHERLKADTIIGLHLDPTHPGLTAELPVIFGAVVGLIVAFVLWRKLHNTGRMLLLGAAIFGTASVIIDVFALGVLWEDSFKVIAELMIACSFLSEV